MKEYVNRHGVPLALYSDRHTIFKAPKGGVDGRFSQFGRAMKELGVELITARSPQAKGRVERANGTLQDRLIKKMRRRGINNMEEGNKFLEEYRLEHNLKFAKEAESPEDAHAQPLGSQDIDKILMTKELRRISKNGTIQYENTIYQLDLAGRERRMLSKEVVVLRGEGSSLRVEYQGKEIKYTIYQEAPYQQQVLDYRELECYREKRVYLTSIQKRRKGIACSF